MNSQVINVTQERQFIGFIVVGQYKYFVVLKRMGAFLWLVPDTSNNLMDNMPRAVFILFVTSGLIHQITKPCREC